MQTKGEAYLESVKKIQFEISSNCNAECPGCVRFLPVSVGKDPNWLKKNVFQLILEGSERSWKGSKLAEEKRIPKT